MVPDGQEEARDVDARLRAVGAAQQGARHAALVAQHLYGVVLEHHLDVGGVEHALLHRLRGAQEGLAHDQVDLAAERCQVGGLLARRVAAADHGHVLLAVEEAVARGAGAHALTAVLHFGGQAEVLGRSAGGYDERLGHDLLLAVHGHAERTRRKVYVRDVALADVGAEALGLAADVGHHLVAVHTFGVAREVFDLGGRRELAARLDAFVEHGAEVRTRGVDCGGEARGAAADDEGFYCLHSGCFFILG